MGEMTEQSEVGEELAERVVSAVRRRRTLHVVLVAAAVLAVGTAGAVSLLITSGDRSATVTADRPHQPGGGAADSTAADEAAAEQAAIYAAALRREQPARGVVYIRDHICASVPANPSICTDGPIPIDVQRKVSTLLGGGVTFVRSMSAPMSNDEPALIVFGALTVTGARATLGMERLCGPLCGSGQTLVLSRTAGHWHVTGETGPSWIS